MTHDDTFILFARPSYLSGAARTLDVGGLFNAYNRCPTEAEADLQALRSDWWAVGDDLRSAFVVEFKAIDDAGDRADVILRWLSSRAEHGDENEGVQLTLADA